MLRLGSSSQTRAELLRKAGIEFLQESVEFDEDSVVAHDAKNFVYLATLGKYNTNFKHFGIEDYPLLVADTVISTGGNILRKARCESEARNILLTQSGNVTSIITCQIFHSKNVKLIDISSTDYLFEKFDEEALDEYLKSGDWRGKAGACMVEGFCKNYIKEVRGFESTAMGLTTEVIKPYLVF
jgi:septum formation protein